MTQVQETAEGNHQSFISAEGNDETGLPAAAFRRSGLLRCMTFMDGSWLYHNQDMLAKAHGGPYKIDFSRINIVALKFLRDHIQNALGHEPQLDLVRTYYYASVPANVHPDDALKLDDQRKFYTLLNESLGFELVLHEIDFRGHYMALQDRIELEGDPNFLPKERTIDMALGINMLYLAAIDAYDIAIAVLGDADYQPALDRVRQLGKRVMIFTIGGSAAYEYLFPKLTTRFSDYPVVRFQDHLDDLRLTHRVDRERTVYTYMCAKCGKVFESTYKAAPRQNMYCDEHRIWRDRAGNGMNATTRESAPEVTANSGLTEDSNQ
ncbi:MAG: NYN domain-containing protein [bacterium]